MKVPVFNPQLKEINGAIHYDDSRVYGVLLSSQDGIASIQEWTSRFKGQGFSEIALRWLRKSYPHIAVNGIGELEEGLPIQESAAYWLHMFKYGYVHELFDDNGFNVTPVVEEEDDLDEFTLALALKGATENINTIATALQAPITETRDQRAERRQSNHAVVSAFIKGSLLPGRDLLEDSDHLYDLMKTNPKRHAEIVKEIFSLRGESTLELASVLIRRYPKLRLVTADGNDPVTAHVMNQQGLILTPNGVLRLGMGMGKVGCEIFDSTEAIAPVLVEVSVERERELLEKFSWVTRLIAEQHDLKLGLSSVLEP